MRKKAKNLTPGIGDRHARSSGRDRRTGVQAPALFVRVAGDSWYGAKYSSARIRIRKGCYQYLIWSEGGKKREFYLGQKKNVPPSPAGAGELREIRQGGKK